MPTVTGHFLCGTGNKICGTEKLKAWNYTSMGGEWLMRTEKSLDTFQPIGVVDLETSNNEGINNNDSSILCS
jgi:hypothetical protein